MDGKLTIDAANSIATSPMDNHAAFAASAPGAAYARAFNTLGWELFDRPTVAGVPADHFFCCPDGAARSQMEALIGDVGLNPIWVGGPEEVATVDSLLRLWITLAMKRGLGRHFALKLLTE